MRGSLRRVLGVAALSSKWILRQPTWMIQDVLIIASLFIILTAWGGREAAMNLVAAWIVVGAWGVGVNGVGQEVGWSRIARYYYMYVASPLKPLEYLAGIVLGNMPLVAVDASVLVAASTLLLGDPSIVLYGLAGGFMLLPVAVFTGLSIVLRLRRPTNISAVTNPVTFILTLLPPVFYPLSILPPVLRPAALLVPTVAAAELARSLAGLSVASYPPIVPFTVLAAWLVASGLAAGRVVRWGLE